MAQRQILSNCNCRCLDFSRQAYVPIDGLHDEATCCYCVACPRPYREIYPLPEWLRACGKKVEPVTPEPIAENDEDDGGFRPMTPSPEELAKLNAQCVE